MAAPDLKGDAHPRVAPEPQVDRGTTIGGYEVIRLLGRGGMGGVYLARDPRLGRHVAIKMMNDTDPEFAARLLVEARATARCNHENIVVIHGADEWEGHPFLVLERLVGESLSEALDDALPGPERAAEIGLAIARALAHAHSLSIVHRDLKPANVFLTEAGVVKVLDFGLAKAIPHRRTTSPERPGPSRERASAPSDVGFEDPGLTQVGRVVGTLKYMAPEQLRGEAVDGRADIYAFGVLLHELLVGEHVLGPETGTPRLYAAANGLVPLPNVAELAEAMPRDLAEVVARCCAYEAADRYGRADEIVTALEDLLAERARARVGENDCPYPGLSTFSEERAELFFGRSGDPRRAAARLDQVPLVAVAGPSGVGKSSLVHAGLVPELLRSGRWRTLRLRPGRHPASHLAALAGRLDGDESAEGVAQLAERLAAEPGLLAMRLREHAQRQGTRLLVVIDQLEELYTLGAPLAERLAFTAAVRAIADDVASPLRVVATIRSDFLDRVAEDAAFRDQVTGGLLLLAPLGPDDLRAALVEPAALVGYGFEGDFVEEVVAELAGNPGALPLMQFTAARLWDTRDRSRRLLTDASYEALGGIEGALASHADAVFDELPAAIREEAPRVFDRLVTPERTRAIATLDELVETAEDPARARELVEALIRARLLVAHSDDRETTVELVHEALITRWPRLAEWLDADRDDVVALHQLRDAARQWDERGRSTGLLWTGDALREVEHLRHRRTGLSTREREFLAAAVDLEARSLRRRRMGVGVLVAVALAVAAGAVIALITIAGAERSSRAAAERARDEAERALVAEQQATSEAERAEQERAQRELAEQSAEASAQQVAERDETLEETNKRLEHALEEARAARDAARREAQRAQTEAGRAHDAERDVRELLVEREQRVRDLERRLSQISTELR